MEMHGTTLVTNFDITQRTHYERAIQMFEDMYEDGAGLLTIVDEAYDVYGNRLYGKNALHVIACYRGSLTNFWDVFRSMND